MRCRWSPLLTYALVGLLAWLCLPCQGCQGEDPPREVVLDWLKARILDGLGLDGPPPHTLPSLPRERVDRAARHGARRMSRETRTERRHQDGSQVILFPNSDSTCEDTSDPSSDTSPTHFTYYFQSSPSSQESVITSAHFWFYAGEAIAGRSTAAPLFILTSVQELLQASERPWKSSPDGWTTYRLEERTHAALSDGPFALQVRCPACGCYSAEADKTPFLHLHAKPRGPERARRTPRIPWSPHAIEKLRRPSTEGAGSDCHREQIEISFDELGWDNWIVHPKAFTFPYCHGTCASPERFTTALGLKQCCAPVPESMRSLRFTTTSDGGFSFKYETLPNIIPEECNCT
ncbi:inhibin alpha chain [Electrophorus electricus]|uniref:inhibin alpha chain n=1 Tax=Electrophorus electricus TaxID=8005 RepID=UPI0015CFCF92|nr:inhibin alpha chain [Electrophorus electricus]